MLPVGSAPQVLPQVPPQSLGGGPTAQGAGVARPSRLLQASVTVNAYVIEPILLVGSHQYKEPRPSDGHWAHPMQSDYWRNNYTKRQRNRVLPVPVVQSFAMYINA
jgi:hypothetical protein